MSNNGWLGSGYDFDTCCRMGWADEMRTPYKSDIARRYEPSGAKAFNLSLSLKEREIKTPEQKTQQKTGNEVRNLPDNILQEGQDNATE